MHMATSRAALVLVRSFVLLAAALCVACDGRTPPPVAQSGDEAALFARFEECLYGARGERRQEDAPFSDAVACLADAAPPDRARIARYAAEREAAATRSLGIILLVSLGEERQAAPIVAEMVRRGEKFDAVGYALIHNNLEHGALRLYAETSEYLLDPVRRFPPEEHERMRQFVCANAPTPVGECTDAAARESVREARAAAQKPKP
jgi:hypothetical protein